MIELISGSQSETGQESQEFDCNRCLKLLVHRALDGTATPVEISALADSISPAYSQTTSEGYDVLTAICRIESCEAVSMFYRTEQRGPAPVASVDVEFPACKAAR